MPIDIRNLAPTELVRLLNSTPCGTVVNSPKINRQMNQAGLRIGDGKRVDLIRYVSGEEIVSVSAEVATRNGEDIDVEDVAVLSFKLESGAVGILHVGYVMALSGSGYHNIGGYDTYVGLNGRRGRLYWASKGTPTRLQVESDHPDWSAAPKRQFDFTLSSSPSYGGVHGETFVQDFLRATWGDGDVPASGKDALQVARVVEAAYESSESGRRVEIPTG